MNIWIVILFVGMCISSPWGAFGILTGISFYYLISNPSGKKVIENKFKTWSWTNIWK